MSTIFILFFFFSLPAWLVIIRNISWDTYLWQVKEYRTDRILSHLKHKEGQGNRNKLFIVLKLLAFILALLYLLFPEYPILISGVAIAFGVHFLEAEAFIKAVIKKELQRPRAKSARNILIVGFTSVIIVLPYLLLFAWLVSLPIIDTATIKEELDLITQFQPLESTAGVGFNQILTTIEDNQLLIPLPTLVLILLTMINIALDFATSIIVSIFAILTEPLALYKRKKIVSKARIKLKTNPSLKVIAITGSYGKSTTKELTYQILQDRYKVVKTPENKNTAVGIAQTISSNLKPNTEIMVAEMGAYKIGEIEESTNLLQPDISIITGIGNQHLSLFGSIKNLIQAKFEIVKGLKKEGIAIFNGDNEYCVQMAGRTSKTKRLYFSLDTKKTSSPQENSEKKSNTTLPADKSIYASSINETESGIHFNLTFAGKTYSLKTNIHGIYNVSNLLAAITAANSIGMEVKDIVEIINTTKFSTNYLNIKPGINGSHIIDDGYNANPTGFKAALDFIDKQKTKANKWIITQGFIELGEEQDNIYKKLAKNIISSSDGIITTDHKLADTIKNLDNENTVKVIAIDSPFSLSTQAKHIVAKNDIVLIEGALPGKVLEEIAG